MSPDEKPKGWLSEPTTHTDFLVGVVAVLALSTVLWTLA